MEDSRPRNGLLPHSSPEPGQGQPKRPLPAPRGPPIRPARPTQQYTLQSCVEFPKAVDYLLQPYRVDIDSSKTLGRLVNMQFVRGEAGRFYLHQVDRDYALSRVVKGDPADREVEAALDPLCAAPPRRRILQRDP